MSISALIVDDEAHARQGLRQLLSNFADLQILAECENGVAAIKAVQQFNPEVIFLDIQMPKLDGFDVLELLGEGAPAVVFVTAHDDYAIQAFEANAVDYLLKPVSRERLEKTWARLLQRIAAQEPASDNNQKLIQTHKNQQLPISRLLIRDRAEVIVIPCSQVMAIEAADDYVVIHTASQSYVKQERLSNLEIQLDPKIFCRIHRSAMVNIDFLAGIETEGRDNRFAVLRNNKQLPISRSGYARLVQLL